MANERLEKRIKVSGLMVAAGLAVQSITHFWAHPLAFMSFLVMGVPLVGLGITLFLFSLISARD